MGSIPTCKRRRMKWNIMELTQEKQDQGLGLALGPGQIQVLQEVPADHHLFQILTRMTLHVKRRERRRRKRRRSTRRTKRRRKLRKRRSQVKKKSQQMTRGSNFWPR